MTDIFAVSCSLYFRNSSMKFIRLPYALHCNFLYLKQTENELYLRTNGAFNYLDSTFLSFCPKKFVEPNDQNGGFLKLKGTLAHSLGKSIAWVVLP